jgi:hypothetical protein
MTTNAMCRALLILNVLYCLLAGVQSGLPGWHMFEFVEKVDFELLDGEGQRVDVEPWLPRGAMNGIDRSELRRVVEFVCRKESKRAPFSYREHGTTVAVVAPTCRLGQERTR